jgi:hypothetical protein
MMKNSAIGVLNHARGLKRIFGYKKRKWKITEGREKGKKPPYEG